MMCGSIGRHLSWGGSMVTLRENTFWFMIDQVLELSKAFPTFTESENGFKVDTDLTNRRALHEHLDC